MVGTALFSVLSQTLVCAGSCGGVSSPTQPRACSSLCPGCCWSSQVKVARLEISHSIPCPGPQEAFGVVRRGEDGEHDPSSVLMSARSPVSPVTVTSTGGLIQFGRARGKQDAKEGCELFLSSPPSPPSFHLPLL